MAPANTVGATSSNLIEFSVSPTLEVAFFSSTVLTVGVLLVVLLLTLIILWRRFTWLKTMEIDQAEFGIGPNKIKLSPNNVDRQIAYQIWVELSTRKIGLEIDLDHDVITEVYDSWHTFFSVTRELIKDVPVEKFARKDTEKIILISIEVLNHGLRPHLTMWQARFRRWYERQCAQDAMLDRPPQEIQRSFPNYEALSKDLLAVNARLIAYRRKMYQIVAGTSVA